MGYQIFHEVSSSPWLGLGLGLRLVSTIISKSAEAMSTLKGKDICFRSSKGHRINDTTIMNTSN